MEINTENKASSESPSSESYSKTTKTSPFGSVWNGLRNLFSNKTTAIAGVLVLVLGLGAGVVAVQRSTEYRQHAALITPNAEIFFSTGAGCGSPTSSITIPPGENYIINLCLNTNLTGSNPVSGFDVTILKGTGITSASITDGADAGKFNSLVFNTVNTDSIRFSKVNTTSEIISGNALHLAKIAFRVSVSGSGSFTISNAQIASSTSTSTLSVNKRNLTYVIGGPTPTPNPDPDFDSFTSKIESYVGTNPFLNCMASLTPGKPNTAWPPDLNGDNKVNTLDASSFSSFMSSVSGDGKYNKRWDLNADGRINVADVSRLSGFMNKSCLAITPTSTPKPFITGKPITTATPAPAKPTPTKSPLGPTPTIIPNQTITLSVSQYCSGSSGNIAYANVSWNTIVNATKYAIWQWNTPTAGTWNLLNYSTANVYPLILNQGQGYTLRVTAENSAGYTVSTSNQVGFTARTCP